MNTNKRTARIGGLLYLFLAITGAYSIIYVPSQLFVHGDTPTTINNILVNEFLFRSGIVGYLVSSIIFLFLVLVLYRLFRQVNEYQAKLMVALVIVQVPISFFIETFNIASLMILKGDLLKALEIQQSHDIAMLFFKMHSYGQGALEIFWGLWLLPFGQLVYRSKFIPRILGILLIIGGIGYIIESFTFLLFPGYLSFISKFTVVLYSPGELLMILWLLIKGIKSKT